MLNEGTRVRDFDIKTPVVNALHRENLFFARDVRQKTYRELRAVRGVGKASADWIRDNLEAGGILLKAG